VNAVATETRRPGRDAGLIYAENRLRAWAKWARHNRETLGYPTISLLYTAMRMRLVSAARGEGGALTANGRGTASHTPTADGGDECSIFVAVDTVVAKLPKDLHDVIIADYFTYGPIEVRCKKTRWRRARYSQLLECAKYSVFAALAASETF
jgi:hypothetical protein